MCFYGLAKLAIEKLNNYEVLKAVIIIIFQQREASLNPFQQIRMQIFKGAMVVSQVLKDFQGGLIALPCLGNFFIRRYQPFPSVIETDPVRFGRYLVREFPNTRDGDLSDSDLNQILASLQEAANRATTLPDVVLTGTYIR